MVLLLNWTCHISSKPSKNLLIYSADNIIFLNFFLNLGKKNLLDLVQTFENFDGYKKVLKASGSLNV